MYEQFYGLRERPFALTSHPKYLLLTAKHREALSNLEYAISANVGMTLLLGQAGTGKTTLLCAARNERAAGDEVRWVVLNNPILTPSEFFETVAHALDLDPDCAASKSCFLRELEKLLVAERDHGVTTVLVVDEAQSLSDALLEELRLLTNLERETEKLFRVILAGQPALGDRLNLPGLEQVKQRIALRCVLPPLDLKEAAAYVAHRLTLAGGTPGRVFSREAIIEIYARSQGIPRTINVLCENALLTGFAADQCPVGPEIVLEVCRDFDIGARSIQGARLRSVAAPPQPGMVAAAFESAAGSVPRATEPSRKFSFAQFASRRR